MYHLILQPLILWIIAILMVPSMIHLHLFGGSKIKAKYWTPPILSCPLSLNLNNKSIITFPMEDRWGQRDSETGRYCASNGVKIGVGCILSRLDLISPRLYDADNPKSRQNVRFLIRMCFSRPINLLFYFVLQSINCFS